MQKIYEVQHIKQIVREVEETWSPITSPTDVVEMVQGIIGDVDREVLLVLVLNTKKPCGGDSSGAHWELKQ